MSTTAKIEKRIGVRAAPERIWEVLSDLGSWDRWNPYERGVRGDIAFNGRIALNEAFPGLPERPVEARVSDWEPLAQLVWVEKRGFLFSSIRFYEIQQLEPGSCILANGFIFQGLRGELFHDKRRAQLRPALETIAERLKAAIEA